MQLLERTVHTEQREENNWLRAEPVPVMEGDLDPQDYNLDISREVRLVGTFACLLCMKSLPFFKIAIGATHPPPSLSLGFIVKTCFLKKENVQRTLTYWHRIGVFLWFSLNLYLKKYRAIWWPKGSIYAFIAKRTEERSLMSVRADFIKPSSS